MSYKINLTLLGGQRTQLSEIHNEPTPKVGDWIKVGYLAGLAHAQVTSVRIFPSKSPGMAVETVAQVEAQEM